MPKTKETTTEKVEKKEALTYLVQIDGKEVDLLKLPVHPDAERVPWMNPEEYKAVEMSIEVSGVLEPITLIPGGRLGWQILDGRHRRAIWAKLVGEGKLKPDKSPLPFEVREKMSALEICRHAYASACDRRHLTSSQHAMMCVLYEERIKSLRHLPGMGDEEGGGEQDEMEFQANRAATNATAILHARTLFRRAPSLVDEVLTGQKALHRAYDQVRQMDNLPPLKPAKGKKGKKGAPEVQPAEEGEQSAVNGEAQPAGESNGDAPEEPPAPLIMVLDANKVQVPQTLVSAFQARGAVNDLVVRIKQLRGIYLEFVQGPGGKRMLEMSKELDGKFASLGKLLNDHRPHLVCPHCKGECTDPGQPDKVCDVCGGLGWLDKVQAKHFSKENGNGTVPIPHTSGGEPEEEPAAAT